MTITKAEAELARRELARRSLIDFVQYLFPAYQAGWVHRVIVEALERFLDDVVARRSPRLMLFMPPRHGKSELVSRYFPAWAFGRNPNLSVIAASYSSDLASRMSTDCQRIIDDLRYGNVFDGVGLSGKNVRAIAHGSYRRTSEFFEIVGYRGSYRAAGVCTGIAGMGADILAIDDPIKDHAEAMSPTVRESVWDWYVTTALTRLSPGGGVILVMTRWNQDDLAGRLLRKMAEGEGDWWTVLSFPAIATRDEEFRKEGEALHPERWSMEHLTRIKSALGAHKWSALYQQSPIADGGNIFRNDWIRYYYPNELPPRFDLVIQSWDMAFKDKEDSDFVVGQVWGKSKANFFLLDQVRGRFSFTETLRAVKSLSDKWPKASLKLVEDKANGPAVMDALKDIVFGFRPVEPYGNKIARAHAVTAPWESGNVFLPHKTVFPWVNQYVSELVGFPAEANDDQVNATTQALNELINRGGYEVSDEFLKEFASMPSLGRRRPMRFR